MGIWILFFFIIFVVLVYLFSNLFSEIYIFLMEKLRINVLIFNVLVIMFLVIF